MKLRILAFGASGDIINGQKVVLELNDSCNTVEQFRNELANAYPKMSELKNYLIAVNTEYANDKTVLHDGDEVAIIPPTSGG